VALAADRSIGRLARAPDFVSLADVVAGVAQQQWKRRDRLIPHRGPQDGATAGVEKIPSRQQRAAARRAGGRVDEGVAKQDALARDPIHVGCAHDVVRRGAAVDVRVRARVAAPVVGEEEKDVPTRSRALGGGNSSQCGRSEKDRQQRTAKWVGHSRNCFRGRRRCKRGGFRRFTRRFPDRRCRTDASRRLRARSTNSAGAKTRARPTRALRCRSFFVPP
jgi:hypothetical protein